MRVAGLTDADALDLLRTWWTRGVHLVINTDDRGFRPTLEPNKFGWSVILRGYSRGPNLFDGATVAEAVTRAMPTVYKELGDGD